MKNVSWILFDTARRVESWILLSGNVVRTLAMVASADTVTVFGKKQSLLSADKLRYMKSRTPGAEQLSRGAGRSALLEV